MSAVSRAASQALAKGVKKLSASMLDGPVSGSVVTLEQGTLSMVIGGERETYERALPVLHAIAPIVYYIGENGQAVLMKFAINQRGARQAGGRAGERRASGGDAAVAAVRSRLGPAGSS